MAGEAAMFLGILGLQNQDIPLMFMKASTLVITEKDNLQNSTKT